MLEITKCVYYDNIKTIINNTPKNIHITIIEQDANSGLTLLISKVSEAILPDTENNHVGEGATMDAYLEKQPGVRFIINGGFSHYRKNFYDWKHQDYQVGDPVGMVKIRHHFFEDYIDLSHYGCLIQKDKKQPWQIVKPQKVSKQEKYILGCTPLLIFNQEILNIDPQLMSPIELGKINPPSVLGHGLQNHPRTAVGIKNNALYFITVEGNVGEYIGCTLLELQQIGVDLQLDALLNLDGGGSSQFRIQHDNNIISNKVAPEDSSRILGHVLVLFDEALKNN